jgi:hypothetical protein
LLLPRKEGAERRQALGCSGTRCAGQSRRPAGACEAPCISCERCSPLGAPPRGLWLSGPRATFEDHASSNTCELLASARSGGGRVSGASRELLARQHAGYRIPTCLCNASRKHPRRTGRQDDKPSPASVKDFRRYTQRNGGHAVDATSPWIAFGAMTSDEVRRGRCAQKNRRGRCS